MHVYIYIYTRTVYKIKTYIYIYMYVYNVMRIIGKPMYVAAVEVYVHSC